MNETQKELMSVDDFLQIYSVSRSMYFSHKNKGLLKVTALGRRTMIRRSDAEAWLDNMSEKN